MLANRLGPLAFESVIMSYGIVLELTFMSKTKGDCINNYGEKSTLTASVSSVDVLIWSS